jgi:hypothetical protein
VDHQTPSPILKTLRADSEEWLEMGPKKQTIPTRKVPLYRNVDCFRQKSLKVAFPEYLLENYVQF